MAFDAIICAKLLQMSLACSLAEPPAGFGQKAVSDVELAAVYGLGVEPVGLDYRDAAVRVFPSVNIQAGVRATDTMRELFDNWNFEVATPLIAEAAAQAGAL